MTDILRGQIWRNGNGATVRVFGVGPYRHDGVEGEALWVDVCDAAGNVIGGRIPMDLAFGCKGSPWTLVGEALS